MSSIQECTYLKMSNVVPQQSDLDINNLSKVDAKEMRSHGKGKASQVDMD